jgi:CopG family transcriptional regulator, nickel-responsive regulator
MSTIQRFSVSVEKEILKLVDDQVKQKAYPNRSEALRAMIRRQAAHNEIKAKGEVIGIVGIVYDHHKPNLVSKMLHIQHDTPAKILGSQHFHLDHHHCVESVLISGKGTDLETFQKKIQNLRGISHTSLSVLATSAKNLK